MNCTTMKQYVSMKWVREYDIGLGYGLGGEGLVLGNRYSQ